MTKRNSTHFYTDIDRLIDQEGFLRSQQEAFKDAIDPRTSDNTTYPIATLLSLMLCGVIASGNSISQIYEYLCEKAELFKRIFSIERIPSYNTFWWLLMRLKSETFHKCFERWVHELPSEMKERIVSVDGKRLKGTAKRNGNLTHLVSAWDTTLGLLLGQVKTDKKSNEITAIPELIDALDLKGATVTIDAAGCQTEIARKIREKEAHYLLALKGNQGTLYDEVLNFFKQAADVGYGEADCVINITLEKGHGRIEERHVAVASNLDWLPCKHKDAWVDLTSLIEVTSRRTIDNRTTEEKRYYISDRVYKAADANMAIRSHWSIENNLHWIMDVAFEEDDCLVSRGHAPENLAILRRIGYELLKANPQGKLSYASRRRKAMMNDEYLLKVLSTLFFSKL